MSDIICYPNSIGAYPHVGAIQDPSWNPQIENHRHTIRKTTVERTFSWSRACNKAWVSDLPRQKLFVYILRLLARFVVLHELGHIWHRHGDREDRRQRFELDGMDDGTTLSPEEATASQARELIADRFAFLQLWSMQEHEQQVEVHDVANFFEHLAPGLLDTKRRRHDFLLQMIYLYFIVMDREDASRDLSRRSHPPAPMRAIALYVDASQGGLLKTTKRTALRRAMTLLSAADALPALLFGRFPNTALLRYQLPDFIRRYSELHPHLATWQRAD